MKKCLVTLLLGCCGCGAVSDPCTGVITDEHAELFANALKVAKELEGLTKNEALVQVGLSCFPDTECQDCFEWLIEKVY